MCVHTYYHKCNACAFVRIKNKYCNVFHIPTEVVLESAVKKDYSIIKFFYIHFISRPPKRKFGTTRPVVVLYPTLRNPHDILHKRKTLLEIKLHFFFKNVLRQDLVSLHISFGSRQCISCSGRLLVEIDRIQVSCKTPKIILADRIGLRDDFKWNLRIGVDPTHTGLHFGFPFFLSLLSLILVFSYLIFLVLFYLSLLSSFISFVLSLWIINIVHLVTISNLYFFAHIFNLLML